MAGGAWLALVLTKAFLRRGEKKSTDEAAFAGEILPSLLAPNPPAAVQARLRSMIEGTRYETMVASLEGMKDRPDRSVLLPQIAVPTPMSAARRGGIRNRRPAACAAANTRSARSY